MKETESDHSVCYFIWTQRRSRLFPPPRAVNCRYRKGLPISLLINDLGTRQPRKWDFFLCSQFFNMIQRQKLLKEMRSRTVSNDTSGTPGTSGTSFLAPLTMDSMKKLNNGTNYSKGGLFSSVKVGQSEKTGLPLKGAPKELECATSTEDFGSSTTILKQFATENAALHLKLEAVAHERNRYRDQVLASIREASRKSVVCETSCQTDPPEIIPESVDKKIVDKLKDKIEVLQSRFKEMVMSNDLLELKIAAAVAHEKESTRTWEAQLRNSASILEEEEERSSREIAGLRDNLMTEFDLQTRELRRVCDEQVKTSLKNLTDDLTESARLREEDKILHAEQLRALEEELEEVRCQLKAQPDPSKCNKVRNINQAKTLFKGFQCDYINDKKFNLDLIRKFDDYLRASKEELTVAINKKFEADAAQYALNLKIKDCESKSLLGRVKMLDGMVCTATQSKLKIANQARCLSERATSCLSDILEKHAQVIQCQLHESHVKDLGRVSALREATLERDRALDDLQHTR